MVKLRFAQLIILSLCLIAFIVATIAVGTKVREAGPDTGSEREVTMSPNVSRCALIFLFLALFGLFFLLSNMHVVENFNFHSISALYQLQSRIKPPYLSTRLTTHNNRTFCAHVGQKPSPEDELEERYLLDSIVWPWPPARSAPVDLSLTSDPLHSLFNILPNKGGQTWHVGDQLEVLVQMHDFQGRLKRYGGDFILARLHSPELGAGVGGKVLDHKNGFYSALFPLLWVGSAEVELTLVHSSEAIVMLQWLRDERPDRLYYESLFRLGSQSETTLCNVCLPSDQQPVCNYTDLYTGEPWYCYKPKMLSCDDRINHIRGEYVRGLITNSEAVLFQSGVNIKVHIKAEGSDRVTVLPARKDKVEAESSTEKPGSIRVTPSGYYYEGSWRPLNGATMRHFNTSFAITQCLTNKMIHIYGDSTGRQWYEYLTAVVPGLKNFDLGTKKRNGPLMAVDSTNNILLKYRCHGPPIRFDTVLSSELRFISNELNGLSGGPNTVVVISVWAHFSTFPVELYIRRLRHIRLAVVRLLNRAPGTLVVIRSANLQALDHEVSLYNSDWYSLQLDMVLKAMFKGMNVLLVDAWQMTLAHHLPHDLHPQPEIIKNMIEIMLSHICPE